MNFFRRIKDTLVSLWNKLTAPDLPRHVLDDIDAMEQDASDQARSRQNTTREQSQIPPSYENSGRDVLPTYDELERGTGQNTSDLDPVTGDVDASHDGPPSYEESQTEENNSGSSLGH